MPFHFFLLPLLYAKCKFLLGIGSSSYSTYSFCKEYDSISVLFCSFCIDIPHRPRPPEGCPFLSFRWEERSRALGHRDNDIGRFLQGLLPPLLLVKRSKIIIYPSIAITKITTKIRAYCLLLETFYFIYFNL